MLRRQHSRAAIFLLSGTLAFVSVACSSINPFKPTTQSLNPVSTSPVAEKLPPSPQQVAATKAVSQPTPQQVSPYERAIDTAESAVTISQSAHSLDDWNLVASRWQQAINWLKRVPASSADYEIAINKIAEYQRHLSYAQQQIKSPISTDKSATVAEAPCSATISTKSVKTAFNPLSDTANSTQTLQAVLLSGKNSNLLALNPRVFSAKIKRRIARTPVIEVTFNGKRTFEMIVDSGASATVITPNMAAKLGVCPDTEVLADTASDKMVKFSAGKIKSIAVQGAVAKNMQVVIANSALNIGLLGQDFFGNYDVWIKQDVVEFHAR